MKEEKLLQAKRHASANKPLADSLHQKLLDYLKRFLVLGGMPEVIARYSLTSDILACQSILDDLLISLKADFTKYKKRVPPSRLSEVFQAVARQTGGKFIYTQASGHANHKQIKEAVELLIMAGLELVKSSSRFQQQQLYYWQREALNSNAEFVPFPG
jgi:predicted AAA+ superfamily ATPase